jgi:hypothetical protein
MRSVPRFARRAEDLGEPGQLAVTPDQRLLISHAQMITQARGLVLGVPVQILE